MPDSSPACSGREKQSNNVAPPTIDTMLNGLGATLSNDGGRNWNDKNKWMLYMCLQNVNDALGGRLKSILDGVGGATFKMGQQDTGGDYHGWTAGTTITFFTSSDSAAIRQQNIYHEFGHLLNSLPGKDNVFSDALSAQKSHDWIGSDLKINAQALITTMLTNDPNYAYVEARQTFSSFGPKEQWADAFANYVNGNINTLDPYGPGAAMSGFVSGALSVLLP